MAQTTPIPAQDATVPAQSVPSSCPAWCDEHHAVGKRRVVHEGAPSAPIDTLDADFTAKPILFRGPDSVSMELSLTINEHDTADRPGNTMLLGMTIPEALRLINELLDTVNTTLPVEEQQFIGPPGFEYVPYGADDLGWV